MYKSQSLLIEQSTIREQINALPEDAPSEELDALTKKFQRNEAEYRAALVMEAAEIATAPDAEMTEIRQLVTRANVGNIFQAAYEHRASDGAERELQAALSMGAWDVPIALLQHRAAGSATAPAEVGQVQQAVAGVVFPTPFAEAMGVERISVPVGMAAFPTMTAPISGPDETTEGTPVNDETGTFTADALGPGRIQRSFTHSIEDAAAFAQMGDALRQNLADSIADGLDRQALRKTGQGLLDFGTDPTPATGVETFARYQASAYGRADGRYANGVGDVKMLVGATTYAHMAALYRTTNADESALEHLMRITGGVFLSANVPAAASNIQQAVFARGMGQRHAVQPVWPSVALLVDPYTESKDGNIRITATALANFKVTRQDGYARVAFRLAV